MVECPNRKNMEEAMSVDTQFDRLPPEMILKIFSYVTTKDLISQVQFVCKRFQVLVTNKQWWTVRILKERRINVSEAESSCSSFNAPLSYEECLREERRWNKFRHEDLKLADGHISTVDAIRLFRRGDQRFCLSGSRDRSMKLWDLQRIEEGGSPKQWEVTTKESAHAGWIWYIDAPRDDTFYSSGWDEYLKKWKIEPHGITEIGSCKLGSAVTSSIAMDCGLIACSTYNQKVYFVNTDKEDFSIASMSHFHRGAIYTMDVQGNYVYSGAEDRQFVVTDVRNTSKPVLFMKMTQDAIQSISVGHGQVVCGTAKGSVKIYNPVDMSIVTSYRVQPRTNVRIRQVKHNRGSVMAMCKTHCIKIFHSGIKGAVRAVTGEIGEPSRFDYLKGDFAICGGLGSIMFWPCPVDVGY